MKIFSTTEKWALATVAAYSMVVIGYGHAALPLGVAVPFVWLNLWHADAAITAVAIFAAVGVVGFIGSRFCDPHGAARRGLAVAAVLALVSSAAVALAITEIRSFTAASALPLFGTLAGLVRGYWRQRDSRMASPERPV
jgi:hypothetical protein